MELTIKILLLSFDRCYNDWMVSGLAYIRSNKKMAIRNTEQRTMDWNDQKLLKPPNQQVTNC